MTRYYHIQICDTAVDEKAFVYVKERAENVNYKVDLYLSGRDMPFVYAAHYILHPMYEERYWTVRRRPSNPACVMTIWTPVLFDLEVEVEMKSGDILKLGHRLTYDRDFEYVSWIRKPPMLPDGSLKYSYEPPSENLATS